MKYTFKADQLDLNDYDHFVLEQDEATVQRMILDDLAWSGIVFPGPETTLRKKTNEFLGRVLDKDPPSMQMQLMAAACYKMLALEFMSQSGSQLKG